MQTPLILIIPIVLAGLCGAQTPPKFTPFVKQNVPIVFAGNVNVSPPGVYLNSNRKYLLLSYYNLVVGEIQSMVLNFKI